MLVVLSGGTGGAKLIEGLAAAIDPLELTIICNTGDDVRGRAAVDTGLPA